MTKALTEATTEHLIRAQRHWRGMLDHTTDSENRQANVLGHIHEITAAALLLAFAKADPGAAAEAQQSLAEMLDDPGSTGPWLWEQLAALDIDADTIEAFPPRPSRWSGHRPPTPTAVAESTGGEPHE